MPITPYPDIDLLLADLLARIHAALGRKLVGLYVYGSLVGGDFDNDISDIDLLAAIESDLDDNEYRALEQMHRDVAHNNPYWDNRIEVNYLSLHGLQTFKTERSAIAVISPGEPFHVKDAGSDWLLNWYMVREQGVTLYGPAPETIIDSISQQEFVDAVQEQAQRWHHHVEHARHSRPFQAYAILTMCRALYAYTNREQVSKQRAATWVEQRLPEWAALIRTALAWRVAHRDHVIDPEATFPETRRFVEFMIAQIAPDDHVRLST